MPHLNNLSFENCPSKNSSKSTNYMRKNQRLFQKNLVYAANVPLELCQQEILRGKNLFGQYGSIKSIICSLTHVNSEKPNQSYGQCYVTYCDQRDSALAIAGFNGIKLKQRIMNVTYGTNRYCNHYLKGHKCTVQGCFYIHSESECSNVTVPVKISFQQQEKRAHQYIRQNLKYYIKKYQSQCHQNSSNCNSLKSKNGCQSKSLTVKQTLDKLIQCKSIKRSQYQKQNRTITGNVKSISFVRVISKPQQSKVNQQQANLSQNVNLKKISKSKIVRQSSTETLDETIVNQDNDKQLLSEALQFQSKDFGQYFGKLPLETDNYFAIFGLENLQKLSELQMLNQKYHLEILDTEQSESNWERFDQNDLNQYPLVQAEKQTIIQQGETYQQSLQIWNKIKKQIEKKRRVKMSRFQFAEKISFQKMCQQFNKVNSALLRISTNKK